MTYKKVILDESILDLDSWLPQEAINALTEIVYDIKIDSREFDFEITKLSETSLEKNNPVDTKGDYFIKVNKLKYSKIKTISEFEYGILMQEAA
ncbi:hypothetical protein [Enterococcus casseliflavus]|uniref:hypothetical protein n=1 Tax=Enterococcus casseliflavus TaxID=37734 RepID=UPI0035CC772E